MSDRSVREIVTETIPAERPRHSELLHEIKYDGLRLLALCDLNLRGAIAAKVGAVPPSTGVCQSLTISCAPSSGAIAAGVTILNDRASPWRYSHSTKLLG
jgi:fructose-1,6-bisphosphatase/sedoheptulose 1,7-bisphosphatase-like protein